MVGAEFSQPAPPPSPCLRRILLRCLRDRPQVSCLRRTPAVHRAEVVIGFWRLLVHAIGCLRYDIRHGREV